MNEKIDKTSLGDVTHSLAKGALGAIPVIGSLATEIFGLIVTPPLEKRRVEWMNEIAQKLKMLEASNKIDFSKLSENEQFIDVVLQATTLALKTSEKEKINAFQNAILNTALGESPDQTVSQIFLNHLDRFTPLHISILKFIDSPKEWFKMVKRTPPTYMTVSISTVIKEAFPDLKSQDDLLEIVWNDLRATGFHKSGDIKTMMSENGALSDRTTELGKMFLVFITNVDTSYTNQI